jgi:3-methylfumaryl-CoA hydratase
MNAMTTGMADFRDAALLAQLPELAQWQPSTSEIEATVDERTAGMLAALFDRAPLKDGDPLPACWHWAYFITPALQRDIAVDGHPRKGGFLPPVELPRRMFAGARIEFHKPIIIGDRYKKISKVTSVEAKDGRSGKLAFVKVHNLIVASNGETAIEEEQDIVYRGTQSAARVSGETSGLPSWDWERSVIADTIMLFRYSAVTYNAHRIHYDFPYATIEEGYRDLVVHGTLLATLMVEELKRERPKAELRHFRFAGKQPVFAMETFQVAGKVDPKGAAELAILSGGEAVMTGHATFR